MSKAILHKNIPLIEVEDAYMLDVFFADKTASKLLLGRLSDRVALVAPGKLDTLQKRLLKIGYTPKVLRS